MELACVLFDRRDMGWSGQQAESGHYLVCLHSLVTMRVARILPILAGEGDSQQYVCLSHPMSKLWLTKQCRSENGRLKANYAALQKFCNLVNFFSPLPVFFMSDSVVGKT